MIRPFECAAALISSLGITCLLLLVPIEEQQSHSVTRWTSRLPGLKASAAVLPPCPTASDIRRVAANVPSGVDGLILDFVGHSPQVAEDVREALRTSRPGLQQPVVVDVGTVAVGQCMSILR